MLRTVACRGCNALRAATAEACRSGRGKGMRSLPRLSGYLGSRLLASVAPSQAPPHLTSSEGPAEASSPPAAAKEDGDKVPPSPAAQRLSNRRARIAPIKLTDRAAERIKDLLEGKEKIVGVRLGVKRRGCNGLSYTMNYAEEKPKFDEEVSEKGVRVFIDPMALMHIVGTVMDFEETELSSEFTFNNPNAKGKCGCGESFSV